MLAPTDINGLTMERLEAFRLAYKDIEDLLSLRIEPENLEALRKTLNAVQRDARVPLLWQVYEGQDRRDTDRKVVVVDVDDTYVYFRKIHHGFTAGRRTRVALSRLHDSDSFKLILSAQEGYDTYKGSVPDLEGIKP